MDPGGVKARGLARAQSAGYVGPVVGDGQHERQVSDVPPSYQALAGQAAAFNDQFVQHLTAGAFSYAGIEATIASLLRDLQDVPATIASLLQEQLIRLLSPLFSQLLAALILSDPLELWAIRSTFASSVAG